MDDFTRITLHGFWANTLITAAGMFAPRYASPSFAFRHYMAIFEMYEREIGKDQSQFTKEEDFELKRRLITQLPRQEYMEAMHVMGFKYYDWKQYKEDKIWALEYNNNSISVEKQTETNNNTQTTIQKTQENDTKECPYCAEIIKKKATVCRFCGHELGNWKSILIENNLMEYINVFEKNKLTDLEIISELTESDLEKLGVAIMGDRKRMLQLIGKISVPSDIMQFTFNDDKKRHLQNLVTVLQSYNLKRQ